MKRIAIIINVLAALCLAGCNTSNTGSLAGQVVRSHDEFKGTSIDAVRLSGRSVMQRHMRDGQSTRWYSVHSSFNSTDVQDLHPERQIYLLDDGSTIDVKVNIKDSDVRHTGGVYGQAYYAVSSYIELTEDQIRRMARTDTMKTAFYDGAARKDTGEIQPPQLLAIRKFHHLFIEDNPEWTPEDEQREMADLLAARDTSR